MNVFPPLKRIMASDKTRDSGLISVFAPNGRQFGQSHYVDEYWLFNPSFVQLSQAEADNLDAFYLANKTVAFLFDYTQRGIATVRYECFFVEPGINILPMTEVEFFAAQAYFRGRVAP